jgi:hypothetical protein
LTRLLGRTSQFNFGSDNDLHRSEGFYEFVNRSGLDREREFGDLGAITGAFPRRLSKADFCYRISCCARTAELQSESSAGPADLQPPDFEFTVVGGRDGEASDARCEVGQDRGPVIAVRGARESSVARSHAYFDEVLIEIQDFEGKTHVSATLST